MDVKDKHDRYAASVARDLSQIACNATTSILHEHFASLEDEEESIRFMETVKELFQKEMDISISNMNIRFYGTKGGDKQ